jgi:hypothetical protein
VTLVLAACLALCACSGGGAKDAGDEGEAGECTTAGDCALGVDYRSLERCAEPGAYTASVVEAEECITALGEVPGSACAECSVTTESGRGGRLSPGFTWSLTCEAGVCGAEEVACPATECPVEGSCTTSLDCFLGYHCLSGTCTSGCDTGFDCRTNQVCVREPPDAEFGRCVFSG